MAASRRPPPSLSSTKRRNLLSGFLASAAFSSAAKVGLAKVISDDTHIKAIKRRKSRRCIFRLLWEGFAQRNGKAALGPGQPGGIPEVKVVGLNSKKNSGEVITGVLNSLN